MIFQDFARMNNYWSEMSKKKYISCYKQENQLYFQKRNAGVLTQVIQKKNYNILVFSMPNFLKEPIITHSRNLVQVILVTPMTFLRQFGMEQDDDNIYRKKAQQYNQTHFSRNNVKIVGSCMN